MPYTLGRHLPRYFILKLSILCIVSYCFPYTYQYMNYYYYPLCVRSRKSLDNGEVSWVWFASGYKALKPSIIKPKKHKIYFFFLLLWLPPEKKGYKSDHFLPLKQKIIIETGHVPVTSLPKKSYGSPAYIRKVSKKWDRNNPFYPRF